MYQFVVISMIALIAFVVGYAFRGFIGREIKAADAELRLLLGRLNQYLNADEVVLKNFIKGEITRIAGKL